MKTKNVCFVAVILCLCGVAHAGGSLSLGHKSQQAMFASDIVLSEELKDYLADATKDLTPFAQADTFNLEDIVNKQACASAVVRLFSLLNNDRKQLLYHLYTQGHCPKNTESLSFLITLLSMVMKAKEFEDSPRFDPNIKLFYTEIKRLEAIANQI